MLSGFDLVDRLQAAVVDADDTALVQLFERFLHALRNGQLL